MDVERVNCGEILRRVAVDVVGKGAPGKVKGLNQG